MRKLSVIFLMFLGSLTWCPPSAFAADKKLDVPAEALLPATITLAEILRRHQQAAGSLAPTLRKTSSEEWTFTDSGNAGTQVLVRSGNDYHSQIRTGAFFEQFGQHNRKRWHQDRNGYTSPAAGTEERSFYFNRVLEDAADPKNDARVLGQSAQPAAYVVEVKLPKQKHPEWIFYDKQSFLIDRAEYISGKHRVTGDYSDFRNTDGLVSAWHIHDTYETFTYFNDDYQRTSLRHAVEVDPKEFDPPANRRALFKLNGSDTIAKAVNYGDVVLRVTINGRGLDFALSSGCNGIVIDRQVAKEMGLSSFGQPTETPEGKPRSFWTMVPEMAVGDLRLRDVAVDAFPFHYHLDQHTQIVGLLGYDFLANVAAKIDYVNETLTLSDPHSLDAYVPPSGTFTIPLTMDSGLPLASAVVGETDVDRFLIDNWEPETFILGGLQQSHPETVRDMAGSADSSTTLPLVDEDQVGTEVGTTLAHLEHFIFGKVDYGGFNVLYSDYVFGIGGESINGIIGEPFLRYYDVTFDYAHARMILQPNTRFFKKFSKP